MAKLTSPLKMTGSIDTLTFSVNQNGRCTVRKRRASTKYAFDNSPRYERSRQIVSEFKRCSRLARAVRSGMIEDMMIYHSDTDYFNRLVKMMRLITETAPGTHGSRNPFEGNMHLLLDFCFNKDKSLNEALQTEVRTQIDAASGKVRVSLDRFIPFTAIKAPAKARKFQVVVNAFRVFHIPGLEEFRTDRANQEVSYVIPIDSIDPQELSFEFNIRNPEKGYIMVTVGILFFEDFRGLPKLIRGGAMNIVALENISRADSPMSAAERLEECRQRLETALEKKLRKHFPSPASGSTILNPLPTYFDQRTALFRQLWYEEVVKARGGPDAK